MKYLTTEQIKDRHAVKEYCIDFVKENYRVRLGYAVDNKFPDRYSNDPKGKDSFLRSVAALIAETGEYLVETEGRVPNNFEVRKNPNYQLSESVRLTNESVKKTNLHSRIYGYGTMIFAAAAFIISLLSYNKASDFTPEQLEQLLQRPLQSLEQIQQFQKGIDESLRKAVADSFYRR